MSKAIWTKGIVCGMLGLSAAADFFTFAIEPKFQTFDMSPLTVMTQNVLIIFIVKFVVIFGLMYLLLFVKQASDYWRYVWLMMAVYLIFFQTLGTISNREVAAADPPIESAPTQEVRLAVGFNFALLWAYYPIGFSMLCFWLWNLGWRTQ